MDQQQIRMNFLHEAEDCFDSVESALLNISLVIAEPETLDLALRATHSIKGGAGMMGFMTLSKLAHRLEDFFKILRVRYHSKPIDVKVETLLLQGVDQMRYLAELCRQGKDLSPDEFNQEIEPTLTQLQEHLGELEQKDEDWLFNQNEDADVSLLMFEETTEAILTNFAMEVDQLSETELVTALQSTCEQLSLCGQMADLTPFIELCQSIQQEAMMIQPEAIKPLCQEALKLWRRSQALVSRGSLDKLPSSLSFSSAVTETNELENINYNWDEAEINALSNALENAVTEETESDYTWDEAEINALSNALENAVTEETESDWDTEEMSALADALSHATTNNESWQETDTEEDLRDLQEAFAQPLQNEEILSPESINLVSPTSVTSNPVTSTSKTVRVSREQLEQLNNLFSKLILERNRVNLRLEQLQNFAQLMNQRTEKLEESNQELRNWYDRIDDVQRDKALVQSLVTVGNAMTFNNNLNQGLKEQFDTLELDRYTNLHLIAQGQIETIFQLKEVGTDINLGLQEINQGIQELNQTMRSLQTKMNRIQMLPFRDLVKGFPRLIRDLNVQYDKQVKLQIEGETTLLDRTLLESLNAPIMHLIRNAFDHGIESPSTRLTKGKPPQGTIKLNAVNRGTKTIITIEDDGDGINLSKIIDRLRAMGKTEAEIKSMSKPQILNSIFTAGFSTAKSVTELSGRGVGMNVVSSNILEIGGDIQVETAKGKGTIFTLIVPFNSSILRVMIIEVGGTFLAIPVNTVREVVRILPHQQQEDLTHIAWQNQDIEIVSLATILNFNRPFQPVPLSGKPIINQPVVIIVGEKNNLGGLKIDRFWGEQEVTIRPIETHLPLPRGFISSLILGDGRILPLIDPISIIDVELTQQRSPFHKSIPLIAPVNNTILIVDDSINIRRYLASTLEKAGYLVEEAKDGQEAVDKLLAGLSVQVVICDIEMPKLDGYGVLEEIKAKAELKSLPIIMLTSRSNDKHRQIALNLGAEAYFSKPYNEQELLGKIAQLLE